MKTPATWGLIGLGNIGQEIIRQTSQPGVAQRLGLAGRPEFIATSEAILGPDGRTKTTFQRLSDVPHLPEVLFVAIPSSDDGQVALDYIKPALEKGSLVVTCEKGALANHFAKLQKLSDNFNRFGVTATVGGGTRLLNVTREYSQDIGNIGQIHLALNGTLAAIMDWVAPLKGSGISLAKAAEQAVVEGYAEPGSSSAAAVIRAEAEGDIAKKAAIFYNVVGLGPKLLDWHDLRFSLADDEIQRSTDPAAPRRFIVSLYAPSYLKNHPESPEDDVIGGFQVNYDSWRLVGGFRQVSANPLLEPLGALTGPGNGIVLALGPHASDGVYTLTGPGAGVNPTVNAMLDDFVRLKRLQKD